MPGDDQAARAVPGSRLRRLDLPQRVAQVLGDRRGRRRAGRTCRPARSRRGRAVALDAWPLMPGSSCAPSELDRSVGRSVPREDLACRAASTLSAPTVTPSPSTAPPLDDVCRRRSRTPGADDAVAAAAQPAPIVAPSSTTERSTLAPAPTVTPSPSTTRLPTWAPAAMRAAAPDDGRRHDRGPPARRRRRRPGSRRPGARRPRCARCPRGCRRCPGGSARASRCPASRRSAGSRRGPSPTSRGQISRSIETLRPGGMRSSTLALEHVGAGGDEVRVDLRRRLGFSRNSLTEPSSSSRTRP